MKKALISLLLLTTACWAVDAYYRHHQQSTTSALEASLVNREIGIDASARNSIVAKNAAGTAYHIISKEMDTAALSGVLQVTGTARFSSAVTLSNYNANSVPFFSTAGLIAEDASNFTYSSNRLTVSNLTVTNAPTFSSVTASQFLLVDGSKALTSVAGTGSGSVVRATSPTLVTPTLGAATATSLTLGNEAVSIYDEGTFTFTGTGFTTSPTGTGRYVLFGKMVVLQIPEIYATSNANTFTLTGLPAAIRPTTGQFVPITVSTDNSTLQYGRALAFISNSDVVTFSINGSNTGWTTSNLKGNGPGGGTPHSVSYTLQ